MSAPARLLLPFAIALLAACGGGGGDGPAAPLVVDAVVVSPNSLTLALDAEQTVSASARAGGQTVSGRSVTWSSRDAAVVSVSSSGSVRGVRAGSAQAFARISAHERVRRRR